MSIVFPGVAEVIGNPSRRQHIDEGWIFQMLECSDKKA